MKIRGRSIPSGIFAGIVRGIEKETLRVDQTGQVALDDHPKALGAALTHPWITTDFAESLLELITQPTVSWEALASELHELNHFVYQQLPKGQLLWSGSMPPLLADLKNIPIAKYGSSPLGRMKHIYREGLVHRYGKPMQMIAGLHYNFSFPMEFWRAWLGVNVSQDEISACYMNLIRHFYRHYWILPYLFGASPMAMRSSVGVTPIPDYLEALDQDTWIGPYATSLRVSDLGYHNSAQAQLDIQYDSVAAYARSLLQATTLKAPQFEALGVGQGKHYGQLSDSILQIENEYYNPIRPKQPNHFPERPAMALFDRGIAYVEVRVLDLNPFEPLGITISEAHFMDVFLFFCMQQETEGLSLQKCQACRDRFYNVVTRGRDPDLTITIQGQKLPFKEAADQLFESLLECAVVMDQGLPHPIYEFAVRKEFLKIEDVSLTPSAQVVKAAQIEGYQALILRLGREHQAFYLKQTMSPERQLFWKQQAQESLKQAKRLEAEPQEPFDQFLKQYLGQALT